MSWFRIEARDGLVLRDGRPNTGRSESQTLSFPYPQTIAGAVRTALGTPGGAAFDARALPTVLAASIRGPLLAESVGEQPSVYVRAPADAVLVAPSDGSSTQLRALGPIAGGANTSLGEGGLRLVGLSKDDSVAGKPPREAASFWAWSALLTWLTQPASKRRGDPAPYVAGGLRALPQEERLHVAIDLDTGTALDGALFGTAALRLFRIGAAHGKDKKLSFPAELSLLVDVDTGGVDAGWRTITNGARPLGGERKLVLWSGLKAGPDVAKPPPELLAAVGAQKEDKVLVRVILLTPAHFTQGSRPSWLLSERHGVQVRLDAQCVGRPETISGWDFAARGPKASRRLVSAGSVFWLELTGEPAARKKWVEEIWMTNVSDGEQERRDGFGLAVVGVGS